MKFEHEKQTGQEAVGGYVILAKCPFINPHDRYLSIVLAYREEDEQYVVWDHNHEAGGFFTGRYFHPRMFISDGYVTAAALARKAAFEAFAQAVEQDILRHGPRKAGQ